MLFDWRYNVAMRCWEAHANGWRLVVTRWAGGAEWTAAIDSTEIPAAHYAAEHVFRWMMDAQAWCETKAAQSKNT
jgi:hypothetical protein